MKSNNVSGFVKLSNEQITLLEMSDNDIIRGNVFSQEQIDKEGLKWLKGQ